MTYLEYQDYLELGGVCDVTAFNRNIDRACSEVDNATFNRVSKMKTIPRRVKTCLRDLIEYLETNASLAEKDIASWSESAGSVSESVSYATKSADDLKKDTWDIIFSYLFNQVDDNGTPLLYKGALY